MHRKVLFIAVIIKVVLVFSAWSQDTNLEKEAGLMQSSFLKEVPSEQIPYDKDKNIRNYLFNFCLRIFDQEENPIVNSSWSRVTRSGQSVAVNLKANNLNIAVLFIPYFINENSIMLLSKSKVILKYVNYSGGKYYSAVDSIPLKIGEKALFFPLGLLNEKVENISSCVLEIEVLNHENN
ncbi:MAG: hypothetical protein FWE72_07000 [Spirochaetaceae bacterium]|nr:hypothetical protein [Spirochaetaceae bacterium]